MAGQARVESVQDPTSTLERLRVGFTCFYSDHKNATCVERVRTAMGKLVKNSRERGDLQSILGTADHSGIVDSRCRSEHL